MGHPINGIASDCRCMECARRFSLMMNDAVLLLSCERDRSASSTVDSLAGSREHDSSETETNADGKQTERKYCNGQGRRRWSNHWRIFAILLNICNISGVVEGKNGRTKGAASWTDTCNAVTHWSNGIG